MPWRRDPSFVWLGRNREKRKRSLSFLPTLPPPAAHPPPKALQDPFTLAHFTPTPSLQSVLTHPPLSHPASFLLSNTQSLFARSLFPSLHPFTAHFLSFPSQTTTFYCLYSLVFLRLAPAVHSDPFFHFVAFVLLAFPFALLILPFPSI